MGWCHSNHLHFNVSKCKVMSFHRKKSFICANYHMDRLLLQRVTNNCDLGDYFDEKMCFNRHVDYVVAKAYSMLGFIKRVCVDMDSPYALKSIYVAYVRSILEYASVIWQPWYSCHIRRIESIQKQFLMFALRRLRLEPIRTSTALHRSIEVNWIA